MPATSRMSKVARGIVIASEARQSSHEMSAQHHVREAEGQRRIDDPMDFVRLETAAALKRDIAVVPVLVQGANMPRTAHLPPDLAAIAFRNGVELTPARGDSDVQILFKVLRPHVQAAGAAGSSATPPAKTGEAVRAAGTNQEKRVVDAKGLALLAAEKRDREAKQQAALALAHKHAAIALARKRAVELEKTRVAKTFARQPAEQALARKEAAAEQAQKQAEELAQMKAVAALARTTAADELARKDAAEELTRHNAAKEIRSKPAHAKAARIQSQAAEC